MCQTQKIKSNLEEVPPPQDLGKQTRAQIPVKLKSSVEKAEPEKHTQRACRNWDLYPLGRPEKSQTPLDSGRLP